MLKRVQHDKKTHVIPNQVLNLIQDLSISESRIENYNKLFGFVLISAQYGRSTIPLPLLPSPLKGEEQ
jgi:hypothetical protein